MTRRWLCGLFLFALAPATKAALGPLYGGTLGVGVAELPATSEPRVAHSAEDRLLLGLVHETLVGIGADGLPFPAAAQGWGTAAAGREWTLRLREGAVFHDRRTITSEDAVRSLRRFLRSASTAAASLADGLEGGAVFRAGASEELPGLQAPDALHVVLRFSSARPLALAPLAASAAALTSPTGAGCGAFVPTTPRAGGRLGLAAFADHIRGRPLLDGVEIVAAQDGRPPGAWDVDLGPAADNAGSMPAATLLLVLDPTRAPFDAAEARAAVAAAVDGADLVRHFLPAGDAARSLVLPALLPPLGLDTPRRARTLSARITMAVSREVPPLVSQRVVAYLGAAGTTVHVTPQDPSTALVQPAEAHLVLFSPEVAEPGLSLLELLALAPGSAARDLLAATTNERDPDRRRLALHRSEAALREADILIPLVSLPVGLSIRSGVHGVRVDLSGRVVLEDAWIEP